NPKFFIFRNKVQVRKQAIYFIQVYFVKISCYKYFGGQQKIVFVKILEILTINVAHVSLISNKPVRMVFAKKRPSEKLVGSRTVLFPLQGDGKFFLGFPLFQFLLREHCLGE